MHISPQTKKGRTLSPKPSSFGKPVKSPRTPTPSALTVSYSDTFENGSSTQSPSQSFRYSDTFETESKNGLTTIKTAKPTTIGTEIEIEPTTIKDLTRLSESFPSYSDTFESEYSSKDYGSHQITKSSFELQKSEYTRSGSPETTDYTEDETDTRTLESVAESSTDRYSSEEFEDDESYTYSESYDYSLTFEPVDEPSSLIADPDAIRKEEELKKISEDAKENFISGLLSNMRNRRFRDTDITELSLIEPIKGKAKIKDEVPDNFSQRYYRKKMALLKHKKKHGYKPPTEKPWPGQRDVHVTEYGLDPQIVEKLKIRNLITKMENAVNEDMHDPKRCRDCRAYEKRIDEEAAMRQFIRMKTSKIQKDITEKQFEQHMIRMNPVNLIGELAKSLPRPTTDPAIITEQLNKGLTLCKHL